MSIPVSALVRLLNSVLDVTDIESADSNRDRFRGWMREGVLLTPDLDLQDISTLARILAGEAYDEIDGRPGRPGPERARP